MATTVQKFELRLEDQDFQTRLKDAAKWSKIYSQQTAKALLEQAKLEEKKATLQDKNIKLQKEKTKASKEQIKVNNAEIRSINTKISQQKNTIKGLAEATKHLDKNTAAKRRNSKATESGTNNLVRHLRQLETLVVAYYALNTAFRTTIGKGIEVNRMMEDNRSGIAALLSANTQMVLSNGEAVNSYEKFRIGQQVATKTMDDLRKASIKTYATFPQLTEIFQQAIGQTLSMGDAFGSTVEEINKNTIKLSQRMSNIAGAIGMPMDRAREEIRSLLSANASTDSLIATMIFGNPGEANKAVRMARDRGQGGLNELFEGMLSSFDVLENVNSYTRSLLNLEDAWTQTMKTMSEPLFEDLKDVFSELATDIRDNQESITTSFKALYEGAKTFGDIAENFIIPVAAIASVYALNAAVTLLIANPVVAGLIAIG